MDSVTTPAVAEGDPGPLVRCPACNDHIGALALVPGTTLRTRCPNRQCRHWIVVMVPLATTPSEDERTG